MNERYTLLPFHLDRLNSDSSFVITNDIGDYYHISEKDLNELINYQLDPSTEIGKDLQNKFIVNTSFLPDAINLLATRYRSKKQFLFNFTTLHMIVLTRRCNQACSYCHASSLPHDNCNGSLNIDMSIETAHKCIDIILAMPSDSLKIEFQGGEPTLNEDVLIDTVEYALEKNTTQNKKLEFVICTNLFHITKRLFDFIKKYKIQISTSFDGPEELHDSCRKTQTGGKTYSKVISNIKDLQAELGCGSVSALTTITKNNLKKLRHVIDSYLENDLNSIFLRSLNPFGYAATNWEYLGYSTEMYISAYTDAINYIISINIKGTFFPELFASLLLKRILTPFSTGFVDLQSPAGAGIQGVVYDINGDILVSDEARMHRYTTGSDIFCIGNVSRDTPIEIFNSEKLKNIIRKSIIESIPGCSWCSFQPYCGSDPIRNYALEKDMIGFRPANEFCSKHKPIFRFLFDFLLTNKDDRILDVFWAWIYNNPRVDIFLRDQKKYA